jgi:sulfonate transport system substrate-binding protein
MEEVIYLHNRHHAGTEGSTMRVGNIRLAGGVGALSLALVAGTLGTAGVATASVQHARAAARHAVSTAGVTLSIGDISQQQLLPLTASGQLTSLGGGLYSAAGYPFKLQFTQFTAGPEALAGISGGSIDLAISADTPVIFADVNGVPLKVVAALLPNLPGADFSIVVPKGSSITKLSQLKGKTISAQTSTINEFFAIEALKSVKLSPKTVTIDNLTPLNAVAALNNGSIAAAVLPEPYVSLEKLDYGAKVLTTGKGFVDGYAFLDASDSALANPAKAAAIGDYLTLFPKAHAWELANKATWLADVVAAYKLPASLAGPLETDSAASFVKIGSKLENSTQTEANVFYSLGEIPTDPQVASVFSTRYNSIVLKKS